MPQLYRIELAVFHALAAGNTLVLIHLGNIIRADGVGRAEISGDAQREAGAAAAVADGGGVLIAGGDVQLMHKTVLFGTLEDLIGLFLGNKPVGTGLGIVDGVIVEVHAHVLFQMAAALAHESAGAAAGTWPHGDRPGVLHQLGHLVIAGLAGVVLDGTLHRDDAHHVHTHVHKGSQHGHAATGVLLKALAQHGVFVALFPVGQNALHDARHPNGIIPAVLSVHPANADHAGLAQLVELSTRKVHVLFGAFGDLLRGAVGLQTQMHHDLAHIVVYNGL